MPRRATELERIELSTSYPSEGTLDTAFKGSQLKHRLTYIS